MHRRNHALSVAILTSLGCLQAISADESRPEIRFCPGDVAHTYPLDSRGRVQSLLAPHIAVINHAAAPSTVTAIHLELLKGGQVVDVRHLRAADIQRFASNSPGIQEVAEMASFMFCGTELIAPGIKLAGPVLHMDEGLVVTNQVFAFDQERDTLRVRAEGTSAGEPAELTATLPVTSDVRIAATAPGSPTTMRTARKSMPQPPARSSNLPTMSRKIRLYYSCRTNQPTPTPSAYGRTRANF